MVQIDNTHERTRSEVADYLREFANKLDRLTASDPSRADDEVPTDSADRKITLVTGNESATIKPPETVTFDVEVDTESGLLEQGGEHSATLRLRWDGSHVEADDELSVE